MLLGKDGERRRHGATCNEVCQRISSLCSAPPSSSCPANCESQLSASERSCVASASDCAAIDGCRGGDTDPAPGPDGGGHDARNDDGKVDVSTPDGLVRAWDAFATSAREDAKNEGIALDFWEVKVVVNGSVALEKHKLTGTPGTTLVHKLISELSYSRTDRVDATFTVGPQNTPAWREAHHTSP